jgi:hypothetical protein
LKLGRLGDVAKANVQEGMAMSGRIFGEQGAKYAEEYFATGGKIYSKEMLAFQAYNQEAADAIGHMVSTVDVDRETYRKSNAQYLKDNAATLENVAKSKEDEAEMNRNAMNPYLKSQTDVSSAILENLNIIRNATAAFATLEENRRKTAGGQAPDDLAKVAVDAERLRINTQRVIDEEVLKNFKDLGYAMQTLQGITVDYVKAMGSTTDILKKFVEFAKDPKDFAKSVGEDLGKQMKDTVTDIVTKMRENEQGRGTPPALPQRADGGVTAGPTVVGEAGAEAVIPLKNGSIPLRIDVSQLVAAMSDQTELTKDVLRELRDGNDLTKKLIDYTT